MPRTPHRGRGQVGAQRRALDPDRRAPFDDGTGALPLLRHVVLQDAKSSTYKLGAENAIRHSRTRSTMIRLAGIKTRFITAADLLLALSAAARQGNVCTMEPMLVAIYSFPKITLYLNILLVCGLGMSAKVAFGAIHGIIPVAVTGLAPAYR